MKIIFAMALALMVGSVYAQPGNIDHMIEFDADSVVQGALKFDKSKVPGSAADNDSQLDLRLNYAYTLPTLSRNWQAAGALNYLKDTGQAGDIENWGFLIGGIYNFSPSMEALDLTNSMYASLYIGMNWNREYGSEERGGNWNDEVRTSILGVGKRYNLARWGMTNIIYSPEIAWKNQDSTARGDFEYSQSLELRFLQFSAFF